MSLTIAVESDPAAKRRIHEAITARLPQWFGRPVSNRHYAEQAEISPAWVAKLDGQDVGLLVLKRHGDFSAEIYWIGIDPAYHRHGIGRALVDTVCRVLIQENRRLLFAFSLHPDDPDENYRRTRRFYEGMGFFLAVPEHGGPQDPMTWYVKVLAK